jgi:hypothetical protein
LTKDRFAQTERLAKVRRLARESPAEGERKAAESKLQELLAKHSITEADLDVFDRRAAGPAPMPAPWPGGPFNVEVVPGQGFGSVFSEIFGGGFSFRVRSTSASTGW